MNEHFLVSWQDRSKENIRFWIYFIRVAKLFATEINVDNKCMLVVITSDRVFSCFRRMSLNFEEKIFELFKTVEETVENETCLIELDKSYIWNFGGECLSKSESISECFCMIFRTLRNKMISNVETKSLKQFN